MARMMALMGNEIVVVDGAAMSAETRAAGRRMLDLMPDVTLYEIIPTHAAEQERGAWGYGRSAEREEQTFRETAARMM